MKFKASVYFYGFLMSSYSGTQKEIEAAINAAGDQDLFFNRSYKKVNNRLIARDEYTTVVIERL